MSYTTLYEIIQLNDVIVILYGNSKEQILIKFNFMKIASSDEQLLEKYDFHSVPFVLPKFIQEEGIIKKIIAYRSPLWK